MCKNMLLSLNNMNQTIRLMHVADLYGLQYFCTDIAVIVNEFQYQFEIQFKIPLEPLQPIKQVKAR